MTYEINRNGEWLACESAKELSYGMLAFWIDGGYIRGITSQWRKAGQVHFN